MPRARCQPSVALPTPHPDCTEVLPLPLPPLSRPSLGTRAGTALALALLPPLLSRSERSRLPQPRRGCWPRSSSSAASARPGRHPWQGGEPLGLSRGRVPGTGGPWQAEPVRSGGCLPARGVPCACPSVQVWELMRGGGQGWGPAPVLASPCSALVGRGGESRPFPGASLQPRQERLQRGPLAHCRARSRRILALPPEESSRSGRDWKS